MGMYLNAKCTKNFIKIKFIDLLYNIIKLTNNR